MLSAWIPTRPYTITDQINRSAAATGSVRGAMAAASADYNGHSVKVSWNSFRKYWVCEYYWGERVVLGRGEMEHCLRAGAAEHARGALGSEVIATFRTQAEMDQALGMGLGFVPCSEEIRAAHYATFRDDRFPLACHALRTHTEHILIRSTSAVEYHAAVEAERDALRALRRAQPSSRDA